MADSPNAPRLKDQVREAALVRHLSLASLRTYWQWIRRFIHFHGTRHPRELAEPEVQAFLTYLSVERYVAQSL